ncbi:pirin-like [Styela clava]
MKSPAKIIEVYSDNLYSQRIGKLDQKILMNDPFVNICRYALVSPNGNIESHPHSGFESVNYVIYGRQFHGDNFGNANYLTPGSIQNINCGGGMLHKETPVGVSYGVGIWVALPENVRECKPDYQFADSSQIPTFKKNGATFSLLMGKSWGMKSKLYTQTPTVMASIDLEPGASHTQPIERDWSTFVYTLTGGIESAGTRLKEFEVGVVGEGDFITFQNKLENKKAELLYFSGKPINEPYFVYEKGADAYLAANKNGTLAKEQEYIHSMNGFKEPVLDDVI